MKSGIFVAGLVALLIVVFSGVLALQSARHQAIDNEREARHAEAIAKCAGMAPMVNPAPECRHCEIYAVWMERMELEHCHRSITKL